MTIGEKKMGKNRACLYLRLSKEDADKLVKGDDSASIKNQRLLLTDYALEHGFQVVETYSDDDESGLYDDRPDFERMIIDAKLGMFDIIIAKTQSRFSRNMEHIEKYLHHDFPNLGIRFIGVVDGVDTDDESNKKSRQINGLVNEWYCEDLSKNIRSSFKAKMRDGQFLGSSCPYGYIKDPKNHNHLIIDEYAAGIVREIYKLYMQGHGKGKIGAILTSRGVLIPSIYKREVLGVNYRNANELETTKHWSYQTIHQILNNETYIGNLIQNKTNSLSYKDKKKKSLPKSQWIVVENTHEPIITREVFDRAQELQKIRTRSVKTDSQNKGIFSGLIFCADCKHAMSRNYARWGSHPFIGYVCKTYKVYGKKFCDSHIINNDELEEAILGSIQSEARKILRQNDIDELKKMDMVDNVRAQFDLEKKNLDAQIEKIKKFKKKSYDSYMEEIITKEEYVAYVKEYDNQILELNRKLEKLQERIDIQQELDAQYDEWVEQFIDYIHIEKLTREIVLELIEKIEVNHDGSINVFYRFRNPYEEAEKGDVSYI